jgi:hypothetical protein
MSPATEAAARRPEIVPFAIALIHDLRRGALSVFLPRWPPVLLKRACTRSSPLGNSAHRKPVGLRGDCQGIHAVALIAPGFVLMFSALVPGHSFVPLPGCFPRRWHEAFAVSANVAMRCCAHCTGSRFLTWAAGILTFAVSYSALDDVIRIGTFIATASVSAAMRQSRSTRSSPRSPCSAELDCDQAWCVSFSITKSCRASICRTGVPVAISTIVGYVLVLTGFVLAMAALGIDLTGVTLLAGALGIGVGLGLQNVVNNFASGLILMLERPINIGDQIDLGGVVGEVKRIGVRSSAIRTSQGRK